MVRKRSLVARPRKEVRGCLASKQMRRGTGNFGLGLAQSAIGGGGAGAGAGASASASASESAGGLSCHGVKEAGQGRARQGRAGQGSRQCQETRTFHSFIHSFIQISQATQS
jgi:hypothetical protein